MKVQKVKKLTTPKKTIDTGKILKAAKLRLGVKGLKSKSKIASNSRSEGLLGRNLTQQDKLDIHRMTNEGGRSHKE